MNNLPLIKKLLAKSLMMMSTLVLLLSSAAPAMAQKNVVMSGSDLATAPASGQGPTNRAELESFLDELMAKDMAENHDPGAAVSVVKDGKLFFTKGYGYAAYGRSEVTLQVNIEAGISQINLEVEAAAVLKD